MKKYWLLAVLLVALSGCKLLSLLSGEKEIQLNQTQLSKPLDAFEHNTYQALINKYVDDKGFVGYQAWFENNADVARLDQYLNQVAKVSPDTSPELFATQADKWAFWVNAYNAWIIKAISAHWPITSVRDVKAPVEITGGFGFFYGLIVKVGGQSSNLYLLEKDRILKRLPDPRIHFLLNCGSVSCPALVAFPSLLDSELESFLVDVSRDFLAVKSNVSIDHTSKTIRLSEIFKWYQQDFVDEAKRLTLDHPSDDQALINYLIYLAESELKQELVQAKYYQLDWHPYDWSLNRSGLD